jgi:hypothetical protein
MRRRAVLPRTGGGGRGVPSMRPQSWKVEPDGNAVRPGDEGDGVEQGQIMWMSVEGRMAKGSDWNLSGGVIAAFQG